MKIIIKKSRRVIENGTGIRIIRSDGNTKAALDTDELGRIIAQMIVDNTGGINDRIADLAYDMANDAIAGIPTETVSTCDPGGTIEVLVR